MRITEELAKFLVQTSYTDIPGEVISTAKERLLDTIGAMLAGRAGWAYGDELMEAVKELGRGDYGVIGPNAEKVFPAARAAAMNATFAHAIELDDGHKFAGVHAGAVIIPTALVMGQACQADGKAVLAAIVLGYEVVYRLAVAQSPELIDHGFHPSATCDTVGAMAVAGKLMGLTEEQMANGLGMAGLQASGLMEATVSGQQSKCVMVGNAAYNGISCAYVARRGLEGCRTVFEGKTGLFQAMSKKLTAEEVLKDLGKPFLIADTYNKFYPTCRHSQPAIEAVLDLAVAHDIKPEEVDHIEVGTHHVAYELTGLIHVPKTPGEAKFSIAYGAAVALYDHGVAVRHLTEAEYTQKKYLDLADRVSVCIDDTVESLYPKRRGAKVRIVLKDGTAYEEECYDLKGSPQNPVGFDELVKKFRTAATGLLCEQAIAKVQKQCAELEAQSDMGALLALLNW
jgi:2-methylcitrate dehydratase PrpD